MIKMLIEDGADINAVNNDKNSALIIAAKNGINFFSLFVKPNSPNTNYSTFCCSFFLQDLKKLSKFS